MQIGQSVQRVSSRDPSLLRAPENLHGRRVQRQRYFNTIFRIAENSKLASRVAQTGSIASALVTRRCGERRTSNCALASRIVKIIIPICCRPERRCSRWRCGGRFGRQGGLDLPQAPILCAAAAAVGVMWPMRAPALRVDRSTVSVSDQPFPCSIAQVFLKELARNAGHELAFDVVTRERMIAISVAGLDGDVDGAKRLLREISDTRRVADLFARPRRLALFAERFQAFLGILGHRQ
jgi:hypothetical protein